jgi:hypothetical protein
MSTHAKDLTTAEEAYAAIDETDKVAYIQHIKVMFIWKLKILLLFNQYPLMYLQYRISFPSGYL